VEAPANHQGEIPREVTSFKSPLSIPWKKGGVVVRNSWRSPSEHESRLKLEEKIFAFA